MILVQSLNLCNKESISYDVLPLRTLELKVLGVQVEKDAITATHGTSTVLVAKAFQVTHERLGAAPKDGDVVLARGQSRLLHFPENGVHVGTTRMKIVRQHHFVVREFSCTENVDLNDGGELSSRRASATVRVVRRQGGAWSTSDYGGTAFHQFRLSSEKHTLG